MLDFTKILAKKGLLTRRQPDLDHAYFSGVVVQLTLTMRCPRDDGPKFFDAVRWRSCGRSHQESHW